jgi:CBS domain-containing protein
MQCQDIMRRPVQFARLGETVAVAARKMREANIGFLVVCSADGKVRGVVTDRDIAIRVCAEDLSASATVVDAIMSKELVTCRPSDDLLLAEQRMSEQQKSRMLIIADDGRALGVISLSDIASRLDPRAGETLRAVAQREVLGEQGTRG